MQQGNDHNLSKVNEMKPAQLLRYGKEAELWAIREVVVKTGKLSFEQMLEIVDHSKYICDDNYKHKEVFLAIIQTGKLTFVQMLKLGQVASARGCDIWLAIVEALDLAKLSVRQLLRLGRTTYPLYQVGHGGVWQAIVETGRLKAEQMLEIKSIYLGVVKAIVKTGKLTFKQLLKLGRRNNSKYDWEYIMELGGLTNEQLRIVEVELSLTPGPLFDAGGLE